MNYKLQTLNELGVFSKGKGITKQQLVVDGIPCIRYGEIYTKHHFIIKKYHSFIPPEIAQESQLIKNGDILFAGSGETIEDIGKAVVFLGNESVYAGGDVIIFSPKNINSIFLTYALETEFVKRQKREFGQGNSVVHIYPTDLKQLKIPIPLLATQQKIAQILTTADAQIDNCKLIIEQLEVRNKGLLRKLLVDNGEWKKVEIRDVLTYEQPSKYLTNNISDDKKLKTPVLTANKSFILGYTDEVFGIYENLPAIIFDDFTTASRFIDFKFKIKSSAIKILKAKKGFNLKFAFYTLQLIETNISSHKRRWISEFEDLVLKIPSLENQKKIVEILDQSELELSNYQSLLVNYQTQKQGLMQQLLTGKVSIKNELL